MKSMKLMIPCMLVKVVAGAENVSPPLEWTGAPSGTDYEIIVYALNTETVSPGQDLTFASFTETVKPYVLSSAKITVRMER